MKIRNGFVSNSSSTSFIVASKKHTELLEGETPWNNGTFNLLKEEGFYGFEDEHTYDECIEYRKKGYDLYNVCYGAYDWGHGEIYAQQDDNFVIILHEEI